MRSSRNRLDPIASVSMKSWFTHFKHLLIERRKEYLEEDISGKESITELVEPILEEEMRTAVARSCYGKTPGPGGVLMELWKCRSVRLIRTITRMLNQILERDSIPEGWLLLYNTGF